MKIEDNKKPNFPPLFRGKSLPLKTTTFSKAIEEAKKNIDPGLIIYNEDFGELNASLILAPDIKLKEALGMVLVNQMGLADSLGSLGPPELAIHFNWPNRIKVNGANCGYTFYKAATKLEEEIPEWLVIGINIPFLWSKSTESGRLPEETVLFEEGCSEITPISLLESWSRHTLVWLNRFLDEGLLPIHNAWCEKCENIGKKISYPKNGDFIGLDENGNMLLKKSNDITIEKLIDYMDK